MNTIKQELLNKIEQLDIADLVIFNNYAHALSKRKDTFLYSIYADGKCSEPKFIERND